MATNRGNERDRQSILRSRAMAYLFVGTVFGLLFLMDMAVPDPVPIVDESLLLLGTALSGWKAKGELG